MKFNRNPTIKSDSIEPKFDQIQQKSDETLEGRRHFVFRTGRDVIPWRHLADEPSE